MEGGSRADLKQAMQPWSDGLLKDLSGGDLSMDASYDTDHGPFMLQGIRPRSGGGYDEVF